MRVHADAMTSGNGNCSIRLALGKELRDDSDRDIDDLPYFVRGDIVCWCQDDVVAIFAVGAASAWVETNAVWLLHSLNRISMALVLHR